MTVMMMKLNCDGDDGCDDIDGTKDDGVIEKSCVSVGLSYDDRA